MHGHFARTCLCLGLTVGPGHLAGQDLYYVEPQAASCPRLPDPQSEATPRPVVAGAPVRGRIHLRCGLDHGSYTVTLSSTDPSATFAPKTFIVNFGQFVGKSDYVVTFATAGVHRITAAVTSNMGSPAAAGQFVGADTTFRVVER